MDAVPYLENKLIDLSYYRDSKAISSKDYENCMNIINNDLRICNGYLLYWRNGYLVKQQTSVKMIADLTSGVQRIGAAVEDLIQNETESSFYDADKEADVNLTNELTQLNTLMLGKKYVDLNDYYDEYLNEYVNYEQKLFENVYYLQQY